jgi:uncharacterized membrane protein
LQIGRPVQEVFESWAHLDRLPQWSPAIRSISHSGDHSHWIAEIGGKQIEWDAEVEQFIPNQAIGWKSLNGPKHTGRITFSPLGNDTVVNVTMNYAPPLSLLRPFVEGPIRNNVEGYLDQVLRDFKAALEGKGQESQQTDTGTYASRGQGSRATGTFGAAPSNIGETHHTRFGGSASAPETTRPSESKS